MKVTETSADLALLLAMVSSLRDRPLPQDLVVFGEVGLAGEIRPVPSGQERISEAAKHGSPRYRTGCQRAEKAAGRDAGFWR